jgi:hypothetical protein
MEEPAAGAVAEETLPDLPDFDEEAATEEPPTEEIDFDELTARNDEANRIPDSLDGPLADSIARDEDMAVMAVGWDDDGHDRTLDAVNTSFIGADIEDGDGYITVTLKGKTLDEALDAAKEFRAREAVSIGAASRQGRNEGLDGRRLRTEAVEALHHASTDKPIVAFRVKMDKWQNFVKQAAA